MAVEIESTTQNILDNLNIYKESITSFAWSMMVK